MTETETVYVLRCCTEGMTSYGGFVWPEHGPVECHDWSPVPECGNGLHGWLWGDGDVEASGPLHLEPSVKWLVVRVAKDEIVDLRGKVKFPRGFVEFCGTRENATSKMLALAGAGRAVMYSNVTVGEYGTATAGDYGTATAGDRGMATAGHSGTATAGDDSTVSAGAYGTATAGDYSTVTAGYRGSATVGDYGNARAGENGTATAGEHGTATAGDGGTATAGNYGTATAGEHGTATAGECGTIMIRWFDAYSHRPRTAIGNVGEDGIEANVAYVVHDGKLARKDSVV